MKPLIFTREGKRIATLTPQEGKNETFYLGTAPSCDVVIAADQGLAPQQVSFTPVGGVWWVGDAAKDGRLAIDGHAAVYEPYTLECISEVEVRDISELGEWLSDNDMRVIFVGDGAEICYNKLNGKIDAVLADPTSTAVHAAAVALCAGKRAERCEVMSASDIAPMYLQPSQAERERLEKIKKELN